MSEVSLRNFDTDLDVAGRTSMVTKVEVADEVVVRHRPSEARAYLDKPEQQWGWEDVRDYVVHEIENRHGIFPRDSKKEFGIFSAFVARWGEQAATIARYAFEVCEGRWSGAPISVNRFCKNSDPFFATVIAERMNVAPQEAWH